MNGCITKINADNYSVDFGPDLYKLKGIFRHHQIKPVVGDKVVYNSASKIIEEVLPRTNVMLRPRVANIDRVAIFSSIKEPVFNRFLFHKMLIYVEGLDLEPILIFTKKDLTNEFGSKKFFVAQNYKVFEISNVDPDYVNALKNELRDKLTVFMGQTGVGKTSTINNLFGLHLQVQGISHALGRGKHTTRLTEIFNYDDCRVIDTPGFSQLILPDFKHNLANAFRDFRTLAPRCKFRNCQHVQEQDCEVKRHVTQGLLWDRKYEDYLKIWHEVNLHD